MWIRLILPITGLTKDDIEERLAYLKKMVDSETLIDAVQIERGPSAIESRIDEAMAGPEILRLVKEAEDQGCNATIIWCGSDPALEASRQLVDIPVIGPGEAMEAISLILGQKPCKITPDIPVLEMRKDLEKTIQIIRLMVKDKLSQGIGDVFLLGCLALWGLGHRLREELGVPILDGAEASIKMAELAVNLGLSHSRTTYPKYQPKLHR